MPTMTFLEPSQNLPLAPHLNRVRTEYQDWQRTRFRQSFEKAPLISEEERFTAYAKRHEEEQALFDLLMPIFREQCGQPLVKTDVNRCHDQWFLRLLEKPATSLDASIQELVLHWSVTQPELVSSFSASQRFLSQTSHRSDATVMKCQYALRSGHGQTQWQKFISEHERLQLTERVGQPSSPRTALAL